MSGNCHQQPGHLALSGHPTHRAGTEAVGGPELTHQGFHLSTDYFGAGSSSQNCHLTDAQ